MDQSGLTLLNAVRREITGGKQEGSSQNTEGSPLMGVSSIIGTQGLLSVKPSMAKQSSFMKVSPEAIKKLTPAAKGSKPAKKDRRHKVDLNSVVRGVQAARNLLPKSYGSLEQLREGFMTRLNEKIEAQKSAAEPYFCHDGKKL